VGAVGPVRRGLGGPAFRRFVGRRFVPVWARCAAVWSCFACCPLLSLRQPVDPRGHYSNPLLPGEMANQSGVTLPDLINPRVQVSIDELFDHVLGASRDNATIRCRRLPPDGSRQVQRRLPPEEIEDLVAAYLAGATALALAGKHSIHRTTVLALLERHEVARRGRVLTPAHIERTVSSYASGRSCASIGKELRVNPETVRQALLKAGVAMRRPGRPRALES
jgi:hypothetical protein